MGQKLRKCEGRRKEVDTSKYSRTTEYRGGVVRAWPYPGGAWVVVMMKRRRERKEKRVIYTVSVES